MTTVATQLNINVFQYELGLDLIGMHQLKNSLRDHHKIMDPIFFGSMIHLE
jgi:hypothetical protein